MLTVLVVLGVLGILFGAAVLATYEGQVLEDPHPDDRDTGLPAAAVQPEDVAEVRFDMVLRGYRMSEVDGVLDRLAGELAARDSRIAALEQALAEQLEPVVARAEQVQAEQVQAEQLQVPEPSAPASPDPSPEPLAPVVAWTPAPAWSSATSWSVPAEPAPDPVEVAGAEMFGFPEVLRPESAAPDVPEATEHLPVAPEPVAPAFPQPAPAFPELVPPREPAPEPEPEPQPVPEPARAFESQLWTFTRQEPAPRPAAAPPSDAAPEPEPVPEPEPAAEPAPQDRPDSS